MIPLAALTVLQEQLREPARLAAMAGHVRSGGFWTAGAEVPGLAPKGPWAPPVSVGRLPDGMLLLHDGHHRAVATWLGGRHWLRHDEYELTDRTYEDFLYADVGNGWYTPLDPRTECRLCDYWAFRQEAIALAARDPAAARALIARSRGRYACPRTISRVDELARRAERRMRSVLESRAE